MYGFSHPHVIYWNQCALHRQLFLIMIDIEGKRGLPFSLWLCALNIRFPNTHLLGGKCLKLLCRFILRTKLAGPECGLMSVPKSAKEAPSGGLLMFSWQIWDAHLTDNSKIGDEFEQWIRQYILLTTYFVWIYPLSWSCQSNLHLRSAMKTSTNH